MSIFVHISMSKARVAAFEAALTDRVHLGADNYGPVVGRTTRAMGDGRTLQQTRCHCGSIWDGHTWGPGKKEWEAHVGSMKHLAWVQSASRKRAAPPYAGPPRARSPPPDSRTSERRISFTTRELFSHHRRDHISRALRAAAHSRSSAREDTPSVPAARSLPHTRKTVP